MNTDDVKLVELRRRDAMVFQYHLSHLLWCISVICVYCAITKAVGGFVAGLALGVVLLRMLMIILHIDNFLVAAIAGTCASIAWCYFVSRTNPNTSEQIVICGWLLYPLVGYVLGSLSSVDPTLQNDISQS